MKRVIVFVLALAMLISNAAVGFHPTIVSAMQAEPKKDLKIGMIVPTLGAQFWANCVDFAKRGAEELGFELVVFNADNKADQINKLIEDAIASGIDGLIFVPYWSAERKAVMDCKTAGIPIITIDCFIEDIEPQDAFANYIAFSCPPRTR